MEEIWKEVDCFEGLYKITYNHEKQKLLCFSKFNKFIWQTFYC